LLHPGAARPGGEAAAEAADGAPAASAENVPATPDRSSGSDAAGKPGSRRTDTPDARLRLLGGAVRAFDVLDVEGEGALSGLFALRIHVGVEAPDELLEAKLTGVPARLELTGPRGQKRTIAGLISRCDLAGSSAQLTYFVMTLVPPLWKLTQRVNCRIFQELTTWQIIERVLSDHGLVMGEHYAFASVETYPPRDYCAQYRESDFDFLSRVMEEEGICYFYSERDDAPVLHFTDGPHGHPDVKFGAPIEFVPPEGRTPVPGTIHALQARSEVRPGRVALTDYAARKPSMPLEAGAQSDPAGAECFDYPGEYRDAGLGRRLARVRLEELRVGERSVSGRSTRMDLGPGQRFALVGHPLRQLNRQYLITRVTHRLRTPMAAQLDFLPVGGGAEGRPAYENEFEAIPAEQVFRPQRRTPRPRVGGPQTAVVVGPPGEEIYTDKYGRVKVRFRWDRAAQLVRDERQPSDASCWIRVSQAWAGVGFGGLAVPRIGQEVIVDFLEGDPDQPIVTGRVYNGEAMQPTSMAAPMRMTGKGAEPIPAMQGRPQTLPATAARTTLRSNSTPGGGGANEVTMDDSAGGELLFLNATRDMVTTVGNDDTATVGNNRKVSVGVNLEEFVGTNRDRHVGANETVAVKADQSITVDGNRSIAVKGNESHTVSMCRAKQVMISENILTGVSKTVETGLAHVETVGVLHVLAVGLQRLGLVGGYDTLIVGKDKSDTIRGNLTTEVKGEAGMTVGTAFVMECPDITLKSGDNFIRVHPGGVTIKGKQTRINCSDAKPGELKRANGAAPPTSQDGGANGSPSNSSFAPGGCTPGLPGAGGGGLADILKDLGLDGGLLDLLDIPADSPLRDILKQIGQILPKIPGIDPSIGNLLSTILGNGVPSFEDIAAAIRERLPEDARKWLNAFLKAIKDGRTPPQNPGRPTSPALPASGPTVSNFFPYDFARNPMDLPPGHAESGGLDVDDVESGGVDAGDVRNPMDLPPGDVESGGVNAGDVRNPMDLPPGHAESGGLDNPGNVRNPFEPR